MTADIKNGQISFADLQEMSGKELMSRYDLKRTTAEEARKRALSQFAGNSDPGR
jgi:hypothetical protein